MSNYLKSFSILIEKLLNGRPQSWLVTGSGIKKSKLNRIINEENEPTLSDIYAIAEAFGLDTPTFLSAMTKSHHLTALRSEIFLALSALNETQLRRARAAIEAIRSIDGNTVSDSKKDKGVS